MTFENGQKIENNSPEEEEGRRAHKKRYSQDSNVIEDNSEQSHEKTVDNQSGEGLETESARR